MRIQIVLAVFTAMLMCSLSACGGSASTFPVNSNTNSPDPGDGTGWQATSTTGAPTARAGHSAIWTGSVMAIWGGSDSTGAVTTGGRYTPATDSWQSIATLNAPAARQFHSATWTGTRMLVWGGSAGATVLNTGGAYDPVTDAWDSTRPNLANGTGAPVARKGHVMVWTGDTGVAATQHKLIVWGGADALNNVLDDGGIYDAETDTWAPLTAAAAPIGRAYASAVWMNPYVVVFGGSDAASNAIAGGIRYHLVAQAWEDLATANQPGARASHGAGYFAGRMVIFGGGATGDGGSTTTDTGGVYDLTAWTATAMAGAPAARTWYASAVTDTGFAVWGGFIGGATATTMFNDGGIYDPGTDTWTAIPATDAPEARDFVTGVWTGSEFIVWGGYNSAFEALNSGGRYTP